MFFFRDAGVVHLAPYESPDHAWIVTNKLPRTSKTLRDVVPASRYRASLFSDLPSASRVYFRHLRELIYLDPGDA